MKSVWIICTVLSVINYGVCVPLYPTSSWGGVQTTRTWANFYTPVQLKPSSWDLKPELRHQATPVNAAWDTFLSETLKPSNFYPTTTPWQSNDRLGLGGYNGGSATPYTPVELYPANMFTKGTTPPPTLAPTKGPELDRWQSEFGFRLRPRSDHKIGAPNSTVFVHGEGFPTPIHRDQFIHPSFNPLSFLAAIITRAPQPLKLQVVQDQPYFVFLAPDFHKTGRFKRSSSHRVKRHHPTILRSVLGELQNYALVPIQSRDGKTSYILLKNPRFVIGASVSSPNPTAAAPQVPAVIEVAPQNTRPSQTIVYSPGVIQQTASRQSYQPTVSSTRDQRWSGQALGKNSASQDERIVRPMQQAPSVDYQTAGQYIPNERTPPRFNIQNRGRNSAPQEARVLKPIQYAPSVDYQMTGQYTPTEKTPRFNMPNRVRPDSRRPVYGRLGGANNDMMTSDIASQPVISQLPVAPSSVVDQSGSGNGQVHKTEVVETVVETQQQQAAVATNDVATANAASHTSNVGSVITGTGAVGIVSETGASASQTSSAGSASEVKQAKKTVTKKTTTTQIKGDGAGGAVQEVSQVVEHSVHSDAAVAKTDTAAATSAVSSASSSGVVDVSLSGGAGDVASAASSGSSAASSSSAASASNSSVKSVKTIKKTTVTKTKIADPNGAAVLVDPVPTAILSDKANGRAIAAPGIANQPGNASPRKKAKTAILSENNDLRAVTKQAALIATPAPKRAAKIVGRRNRPKRPQRRRQQGRQQRRQQGRQQRRQPRKRKTTTKAPPTTPEAPEIEMEEMTTSVTTTDPYGATAIPTAPYYGPTPPYTATQPPLGVAGWAGPTTESALGPHDRINTTDVPEEIEARPDKTPAEKRAELRKLAKQRARSAGRSRNRQTVAKQPVAKQPVNQQTVARQQRTNSKPRRRQIQTRNNRVATPPGQSQSQRASQNKPVRHNILVRDRHVTPFIPNSRQYDPSRDWAGLWPDPTTTPQTTPPVMDPEPVTRGPRRRPPPGIGRRQWRRINRGRGRPRPTQPPTNNRGNGRSRDVEEPVRIRDPVTRWIYNNMETELLENIMPLFLMG